MPYKDPDRQRESQRLRVARIRSEWLADKSCVRCGSTDELQVDHIDPATKVDHKVWSWTPARREAELAKCQVLCWPHHKEKTAEDRRKTAELKGCGTISSYRRGCNCGECREANNARSRQQRERSGEAGKERRAAYQRNWYRSKKMGEN